MSEYKYKAFISYRHTEFDKTVADKLQKILEAYRPPANLAGKEFRRRRVFRDETELPTSSDLGNDINDALRDSEYLICICSPEYPKSRWCMAEINTFKSIHGGSSKNILAILIDGTPGEAFPEALLYDEEEQKEIEPLAANIVANSKSESMKKLKTEVLRIIAPMLGCGFDDLYQREKRRDRRRKRLLFTTVCSILAVIASISTVYAINIRNKNDRIAEQNVILTENKNKIEEQNAEILREYASHLCIESEQQFENGEYIPAIRTALEALPSGDKNMPVLPEAESILSRELFAFRDTSFVPVRELAHDSSVQEMHCMNNGKTAVTRDLQSIYVWDTENGRLLKKYPLEDFYDDIESLSSFDRNIDFIYEEDRMIDRSVIPGVNSYVSGIVPGLGNVIYTMEKEEREETQTGSDALFIANSNGTIWRISETGELLWKSDHPSKNSGRIIYSEGFLYQFDSSLFAVNMLDPDTGSIINSYTIEYPDRNDMSPYFIFADEQAAVILNNTEYFIQLFKNEKNSYTKTKKIPNIENLFAYSDVKKIGGNYYLYSYISLSTTNKYSLKKYSSDMKKELWSTTLTGYGGVEPQRTYCITADKTECYTDLTVSVRGGNIAVTEDETGELVTEYNIASGISECYCSEDGNLFVIAGDRSEYAIELSRIKRKFDSEPASDDSFSNIVRRVNRFETNTSLCSYCNNTYLTAGNNSNIIYVHKKRDNSDYEELIRDKSVFDYNKYYSVSNTIFNPSCTVMAAVTETIENGAAVRELFVYDKASEKRIKTPFDEGYDVRDLIFLDDSVLFIGSSEKQKQYLYDIEKNTILAEIEEKSYHIDSFITDKDKGAVIFNTSSDIYKLNKDGTSERSPELSASENSHSIEKIAYAADPDMTEFAAVTKDDRYFTDAEKEPTGLNVYNFSRKSYTRMMTEETELTSFKDIMSLFFPEDGRLCAVTSSGKVCCFDTKTGGLLWETDTGGIIASPIDAFKIDKDSFGILCDDKYVYEMTSGGFTGRKVKLKSDGDYDPVTVKQAVGGASFEASLINGGDTLLLSRIGAAWFIDRKDFRLRYCVEDGFAQYCENDERIYICNDHHKKLGSIPVYTTEELIKKAEDYLKGFSSEEQY